MRTRRNHCSFLRLEEVIDVRQVTDVGERELLAGEVGRDGEALLEDVERARELRLGGLDLGLVGGHAEHRVEDAFACDLQRWPREVRVLDGGELIHHRAVLRAVGHELRAGKALVEVADDRARLVHREAVVFMSAGTRPNGWCAFR